jgi:hypothetical protein
MNEKLNKNKTLRIFTIVAVTITAFFICFKLFTYSQNLAQKSASFITVKLDNIGGQKLCSSGATGREFLSSTNPWFEVYYLVPDKASDLSKTIIDEFSSQNLNLITTSQFVQQYGREGHGFQVRPLDYEDKPENNFYISKTSSHRALINIIGEPEFDIKCKYNDTYQVTIPSGSKLVEVNWNEWW